MINNTMKRLVIAISLLLFSVEIFSKTFIDVDEFNFLNSNIKGIRICVFDTEKQKYLNIDYYPYPDNVDSNSDRDIGMRYLLYGDVENKYIDIKYNGNIIVPEDFDHEENIVRSKGKFINEKEEDIASKKDSADSEHIKNIIKPKIEVKPGYDIKAEFNKNHLLYKKSELVDFTVNFYEYKKCYLMPDEHEEPNKNNIQEAPDATYIVWGKAIYFVKEGVPTKIEDIKDKLKYKTWLDELAKEHKKGSIIEIYENDVINNTTQKFGTFKQLLGKEKMSDVEKSDNTAERGRIGEFATEYVMIGYGYKKLPSKHGSNGFDGVFIGDSENQDPDLFLTESKCENRSSLPSIYMRDCLSSKIESRAEDIPAKYAETRGIINTFMEKKPWKIYKFIHSTRSSGKCQCGVEVSVPKSIAISPANSQLLPNGGKLSFVVEGIYYGDKKHDITKEVFSDKEIKISWVSSKQSVASIDDAGLATSNEEGVTKITAKLSYGALSPNGNRTNDTFKTFDDRSSEAELKVKKSESEILQLKDENKDVSKVIKKEEVEVENLDLEKRDTFKTIKADKEELEFPKSYLNVIADKEELEFPRSYLEIIKNSGRDIADIHVEELKAHIRDILPDQQKKQQELFRAFAEFFWKLSGSK